MVTELMSSHRYFTRYDLIILLGPFSFRFKKDTLDFYLLDELSRVAPARLKAGTRNFARQQQMRVLMSMMMDGLVLIFVPHCRQRFLDCCRLPLCAYVDLLLDRVCMYISGSSSQKRQ